MSRILAPLAILLFISPVCADDSGPTVEFAVADGWVNLRLFKDATPVTDAHILVLVGEGVLAEGDTDENGKGSFPAPPGGSCQVVFVYKTGTSAPVPLTFADGKVTPPSAVVGGAKPPCCLVAPPSRDAAHEDDTALNRQRLAVFAAVLLVAGAAGAWAYRRVMRPGSPNGDVA